MPSRIGCSITLFKVNAVIVYSISRFKSSVGQSIPYMHINVCGVTNHMANEKSSNSENVQQFVVLGKVIHIHNVRA